MQGTSSSLVQGITDFADHQRWFEFNQIYRPMIRKILSQKGLHGDELEDVVQEVYLALLSTIQRFRLDRDKGKFRSWLSRVTQNVLMNHFRKTRRESSNTQNIDAELEEAPVPDFKDDRVELCLNLVRSQFDDRTWLPFYLRVIEEVPMEEVQTMTGMSRNAIYQSVHRVRQCLRDMLSQLSDPY